MKKIGRKKGKKIYAVVDNKNKIHQFVNVPSFGDNVLMIFFTKKIANQYCPKGGDLKVVAVETNVVNNKVKAKKNESIATK